MLDVVHEEKELPKLRDVMRNFYSPLKACDPYLRYVFLTGITKFSQLSIFSELNNIKNISMDEPYAAICGITENEILTQMKEDVDRMAVKLNITAEEVLAKLKENYAAIISLIHRPTSIIHSVCSMLLQMGNLILIGLVAALLPI